MAPSWPIVLTGSYADGSLCKASDYRSDFETLRDAVNQLFERFSSFEFNALAVSAEERLLIADTVISEHNFARGSATDRTVVKIFRVPTWMQGIRIRQFEATNCTRFNVAPVVVDGESYYFSGTVTIELSVADDPSKFDPDSWTATTVSSLAFIGGGTAGGHDDQIYGTTDAADVENAVKRNELAYTIQPNNYLAVSIKGSITHGDIDLQATPALPLWMFQVTTLCDTMVPIP